MTDAIFDKCVFDRSWAGRCGKPCHGKFCTQHENLKCVSCGEPAERECDYTGQFVCGAPLCGECEDVVADEGADRGLFFMGHKHGRKLG